MSGQKPPVSHATLSKSKGTDKSEKSPPKPENAHVEQRAPVGPLALSAIQSSTGLDESVAREISKRLFLKNNETRAVLVCFDIRESTSLMLNLEDFNGYAKILAEWASTVKYATTESGGWFDKFTGDGALVFWEIDELNSNVYERILECVRGVCYTFIHNVYMDLSHHAGCLPGEFGLSTGIDYGRVTLSDLSPPEGFKFTHHERDSVKTVELGLKPVTSSITALGRPVVGASRLSDAARPYEVLAGPQFGVPLDHNPSLLPHGFHVENALVELRHPFGEQLAYRIRLRDMDYELSSHFPHLLLDKSGTSQARVISTQSNRATRTTPH